MTAPASPGTVTRQQLYDRIRESSKDEVILEEMIRLGFWPDNAGRPEPAADLIRERGDLTREMQELQRQNALWNNPERALKEMHKRRKQAALDRRKETRLKHANARQNRADAWHERQRHEVLYLGGGVSAGLNPLAGAADASADLPLDAKALAGRMGIALGELRFLAFNRPVSTVSHYKRFRIPKKTGGERLISAPMPRLKRAQYWILDNVLAKSPLHDAAHGFVPGRSILTNARQHVGREVVVNLDLKDFFPTLTYKRVKGLFRSLGFAEPAAIPLALLTTEPVVDEVELDGKTHFVANGSRLLPQGAPTSPAITNLICRRLDQRLADLAAKLGFTYTRYADDMTFSASGDPCRMIGTLIKAIHGIVEAEGFRVHPDKTRIMRRSGRQEVTGLTVNEQVSVPRDTLRRFRAVLHLVEKQGPEGKRFGPGRNLFHSLVGFGQFVNMIDADAGAPLLLRARKLAAAHAGGVGPRAATGGRAAFRRASAAGLAPAGNRWTPAERPPPPRDLVLAAVDKLAEKEAAKAATARPPPPSPSAPSNRSAAAMVSAIRNSAREAPGRTERAEPSVAGKKSGWSWFGLIILVLLLVPLAAANPIFGMIIGIACYFMIRHRLR